MQLNRSQSIELLCGILGTFVESLSTEVSFTQWASTSIWDRLSIEERLFQQRSSYDSGFALSKSGDGALSMAVIERTKVVAEKAPRER